MKKLVVLVNQLLNKHNCDRFDISNKKNLIHKEFWCLLPITNKKLYEEYNSKKYRVKKNKNFIIIKNHSSLLKKIFSIKENDYFINWADGYKFSFLLEILLNIKGAKKIFRYFTNINSGLKLKENWLKKVIKNLLNILKSKIYIYFAESQANMEELKKIKNSNSKIIKINSFDYTEYHNVKKSNKIKNKHILFLDSNIEKSYESQLLNYKSHIDSKNYWNSMTKIFELYERKYNNKVIVASHFRRSLNDQPIPRKFHFDQTAKLISEAKIVLCHASQAIHWAVYFKKPIILIFFKDFQKTLDLNRTISDYYKKKLGLKRINVGSNFNFNYKINKDELKINKKKYIKFEQYYLSNPNTNFRQINGWDTVSEIVAQD